MSGVGFYIGGYIMGPTRVLMHRILGCVEDPGIAAPDPHKASSPSPQQAILVAHTIRKESCRAYPT